MNADDVQELLDEIEENKGFVSAARVFNKPSLISISSADREPDAVNQTPYSQVAFSSFAVNLPRPALDVDSIQLVSSNLPMCNNNIPDPACAFWYYRLSLYSGIIPNSNNLFMNRLLPSYYKPELVNQVALFGLNKTFLNYTALSTEMAKASANDLALYNWETLVKPAFAGPNLDRSANAYIPFQPNDFLVSYNPTYNKFQGTGLTTAPATAIWSGGTTYALGAIVQTPLVYTAYSPSTTYTIGQNVILNFQLYTSLQNDNINFPVYLTGYWKPLGDLLFYNRPATYISLQAANLNHTPASSPTWWKRIAAEAIQPWNVDITYNIGRVVLYNDVLYISTAQVYNNAPSGLNGWAAVDTDFYRYLITGPQDPNVIPAQAGVDPFVVDTFPKLEWNQYALYEVGDRVEYNGQLWRCIQQNQNAIPQQVDTFWDAGNAYNAGNIVRYRGVVYQALQVVPAGFDPENYTAYWKQITYWGWDDCNWDTLATYVRNDCVIHQGLTYALDEDFNQEVEPPLRWSGTDTYLTGVVVVVPIPSPTPRAKIAYVRYVSLSNASPNFNKPPQSSPTFWELYEDDGWVWIDPDGFSAPSYGLFTASANFDFVEQVGQTATFPFPVGIQPQPFNPIPKRLLNSIAGFTFNGIFNPDAYQELTVPAERRQVLTQFTSQFNRLRPVPQYAEVEVIGLGALRDPVATATRVYTADGYCNLVYSSIISTYCDVVGASSLDTRQTTNLLAVNTMNCGNLGISFYAPFIDNPLTKMQNDIYTIFVEFRDEFGDLYHFTNNAVVTLTFKVTYKK
jgi:hypothetical protein